MTWLGREVTAEAAIITLVSGYEFFSLSTGRVPPITHFVRKLPLPGKVALVAGLTIWEVIHFEVIMRAMEELEDALS